MKVQSNYFRTFFLFICLTGVCMCLLTLAILYYSSSQQQTLVNSLVAQQYLQKQQAVMDGIVDRYRDLLQAIEQNPSFNRFLGHQDHSLAGNSYEAVYRLFDTLVAQAADITQLRYLDDQGNEIIRVDRPHPGDAPLHIQKQQLQNKKHRDYFIKTMQMERGVLTISHLDLNIEHHAIEVPHKPVLRFSLPVFFETQKVGMLAVNIFMASALDHMVDSSLFKVIVYDQDGEVLVTNRSDIPAWSRYLKRDSVFSEQELLFQRLLFDNPNEEKLYIGISAVNPAYVPASAGTKEILFAVAVVLPLALLLAWGLSRIPGRLVSQILAQQETIAASEQLYRQIFSEVEAVRVIVEADSGTIMDVSDAACHFYGWQREQLLGMSFQMLDTSSEARLQMLFNNAACLKDDAPVKALHRLADGSTRPVHLSASPLSGEESSLIHIEVRPEAASVQSVATQRLGADALSMAEDKVRHMQIQLDTLKMRLSIADMQVAARQQMLEAIQQRESCRLKKPGS